MSRLRLVARAMRRVRWIKTGRQKEQYAKQEYLYRSWKGLLYRAHLSQQQPLHGLQISRGLSIGRHESRTTKLKRTPQAWGRHYWVKRIVLAEGHVLRSTGLRSNRRDTFESKVRPTISDVRPKLRSNICVDDPPLRLNPRPPCISSSTNFLATSGAMCSSLEIMAPPSSTGSVSSSVGTSVVS